MRYESVIGLEVHLQLNTATKIFCSCATKFGQRPNSQVCPVCLGMPGSLPVLNEKAFHYAIKVALALGCGIQNIVKFDRKNYYYPDLPKNFQISQYDMPIAYKGHLDISIKDAPGKKRIGITRVHLEEDAGKLIHPEGELYSLVDLNRTGLPLLEIVTEPDISSPREAYDYLTLLKTNLEYLKVSDCDMEKGSLRCDANVSIRPEGEKRLGTKVELKNMNSFKNVRLAIEYEIKRQKEVLSDGDKILQETRLWDADKEITVSMRTKEGANDYRYFPEPDLVPFVVDKELVEKIRKDLPESPTVMAERFVTSYNLSEYDAAVMTGNIDFANYFEKCASEYGNKKAIANWMMGDVLAYLNEKNISIKELNLTPERLLSLLRMVDKGELSSKMAKEVLIEAIESARDPKEIVSLRSLSQISDSARIEEIVKKVISGNEKSVSDYKAGKKNAIGFLVGQVMKETKGAANPTMVNEILKKNLEA